MLKRSPDKQYTAEFKKLVVETMQNQPLKNIVFRLLGVAQAARSVLLYPLRPENAELFHDYSAGGRRRT